MKIVINTCYGGFDLSVAAIERIAEIQGRPCYWFDLINDSLVPIQNPASAFLASAYDLPNPEESWPHDKFPWSSLTLKQKAEHNAFGDAHRIPDFRNDRTNPLLIQVVEELGKNANGRYAKLKVVKIPDDVEWEIDEYDGREVIHEKHRSWC